MTRDRALLVVFVLLLIAGVAWYRSQSTPPAPPALSPDPASNVPAAAVAAADGNLTAAADSNRTAVAVARDPADADRVDDVLVVRGRCVRASDGEPLAGCDATLRIEPDAAAAATPWHDDLAQPRAASAIDGTFELSTDYDAWTDTIALRLTAAGYAPRVGRWPRPTPGSDLDLGDIPMVAAITVTGIIVDQEGAPVADAGMMFVDVQLNGAHQVATETMLRARSDAAGRFAFPLPAYPAEWWIGAEDTGALIEPRSVKLSGEPSSFELRVVVERPDPQHSITGIVVDASNHPLANVRLTATGEGFIGSGRSGSDGRFTVQRAGPVRNDGKQGTLLSCTDADLLHEQFRPGPDQRIAWGTDGVEVVMRQRASQSVRVIDARGEPVTDYALFAFRGRSQLLRLSRPNLRGPHPDGRCQLTGLQSGNHALVVLPRRPHLASTAAIPFVVDPDVQANELLVTIDDRVPLQVTVTTAGERAIPASQVQLLQSFTPEPPGATSSAVLLAEGDRSRTTPGYVIVAAGVTDDDGIARLSAPPGSWTLRILGAGHVPVVQPIDVFPPTSELRVVVAAAAQLHGQLQPEPALHTLQALASSGDEPIAVVLTPIGEKALPAAAIDADGRYLVGGLPPGDYAVSLRYWLRTGEVRADSVVLPVATVALVGGQRRELPIEVSAMLPGTVRGRVIAGGEPLRDVHCFLRRNGPGPALSLRVATDAEGRYTGAVPPGDYGFAITYPAQPGPGWLLMVLPDEWHLAPGEAQEVNFDVPLRRIRVRLLADSDAPIANQPVKVARDGYSSPGSLTTDAQGWVEVFPAPFDAFRLVVTLGGDQRRVGPIDLPSGQTVGEVTVRASDQDR